MAKKSRKRSAARQSMGGGNSYMNIAKRGLAIVGGLAVGTIVKNAIGKDNTSAAGTDLLGLSGEMSTMASNGIVTALGVVGTQMLKDPIFKDVALGVAVAGGAGLVNTVAGKSVVSLGETDDQPVMQLLPGLGESSANVTYNDLPDENQQVTTYNPVYEAGDIDISSVGNADVIL